MMQESDQGLITVADTQTLKRMRSLTLHDALYGVCPFYEKWTLEGNKLTGLERASIAIAFFPTLEGETDIEIAQSLLNHPSLKYYLNEVTQLQIPPALEKREDFKYGNLVITADRFYRAFSQQGLALFCMPSLVIVFDDLSRSKRNVQMICPANIPPSVGLRQTREQVCRKIGKKWLSF